MRQSTQYNGKSHKNWKPFEVGQTVWLWRPKTWKFGRKWIGPYEVCSRRGVTYNIRSNNGKFLIVHHNQLRYCPTPLDQGQRYYPVLETPGILPMGSSEAAQQEEGPEVVDRGIAGPRPPRLRQVINPPEHYCEFVAH